MGNEGLSKTAQSVTELTSSSQATQESHKQDREVELKRVLVVKELTDLGANTCPPSALSLNCSFSKYGPRFPEVKIISIVIVRDYLHFYSFSQEYTMEFSRTSIHVLAQKSDMGIHLPSLKPAPKEIHKSVKQWHSSHYNFFCKYILS